ncbi:MAG: response regulator [Methyloprofundus sp.]|nr:response regulator [Methyloprofundus sp.]MDT8426591.1 response regulator [Methyloprofundus sp.]
MNNIRPILLAEDDHVDVMTVRRAFKQLNVLNELIVAKNGEEVIGYLDDPKKPLPCLIILDINMPKMNGLECLKILKQQSVYKNIPVFILSSSREQQDVDSSFARGISGYILKPIEFDEFLRSIKVLNSHWTVDS